MKPEKILEYAELAACYFRALVDKGVAPPHAVSLASSFVGNVLFASEFGKEPRQPWEGDDKP